MKRIILLLLLFYNVVPTIKDHKLTIAGPSTLQAQNFGSEELDEVCVIPDTHENWSWDNGDGTTTFVSCTTHYEDCYDSGSTNCNEHTEGTPIWYDCAGVEYGSAYENDCGDCVGGWTGRGDYCDDPDPDPDPDDGCDSRLDELISEVEISDQTLSIATQVETPELRNKYYEWVFLTNGLLSFISRDHAVQEKGPDSLWRFVSLTHDGDSQLGAFFGITVTYRITQTIIEIGSERLNAIMVLKPELKFELACKGSPVYRYMNYTCPKRFNVND